MFYFWVFLPLRIISLSSLSSTLKGEKRGVGGRLPYASWRAGVERWGWRIYELKKCIPDVEKVHSPFSLVQ